MTGNIGTYIVFGLGVLVGMILGNKDFRYKFFKGLRGFLGNVGKGAKDLNTSYRGGSSQYRKPTDTSALEDKPQIQHIYRKVHAEKECLTCKGSGKVYRKVSKLQEGAPGYEPEAIDCPKCNGMGLIWD